MASEDQTRVNQTTPTPEQRTAFAQEIAEDIADEMLCPDAPPCCDDCACWREAAEAVSDD